MFTHRGPLDEMRPLPNHDLPRRVRRMGFAGDDELHGAPRIGEDSNEPLRIAQQQIWSFIRGKAARKAERQCVYIKNVLRTVNLLG